MSDVIQWFVIVVGLTVVGFGLLSFGREWWLDRGLPPMPWWETYAAAEVAKPQETRAGKILNAVIITFPVWAVVLVTVYLLVT